MGINQNDLRVIKTKMGLRDAFIQLLLEKGYDAISIQDIATKAKAARVTFYRHYKNKEELLVDCLNTLFEEYLERLNELPADGETDQPYLPALLFYEHMQEKEILYKILFSSRGTNVVIEQLKTLFADRAKRVIGKRTPPHLMRVPLDIVAYHTASAQIGLAIWWLENNKPYPMDYMAKSSLWLSLAGVLRGIGQDEIYRLPPQLPKA